MASSRRRDSLIELKAMSRNKLESIHLGNGSETHSTQPAPLGRNPDHAFNSFCKRFGIEDPGLQARLRKLADLKAQRLPAEPVRMTHDCLMTHSLCLAGQDEVFDLSKMKEIWDSEPLGWETRRELACRGHYEEATNIPLKPKPWGEFWTPEVVEGLKEWVGKQIEQEKGRLE